jgi:ATPase family associated with various cellular activities (AAA)
VILLQQSSSSALWDDLERVLTRLQAHARQQVERAELEPSEPGSTCDDPGSSGFVQRPAGERWNPAIQLQELFGLSRFEVDTVLLCAGFALDRRFEMACAELNAGAPLEAKYSPSFGLAASVLEEPHWSAMSRTRPLLYWRLLELGEGPLLRAPLEIDERVLHYLLGVAAIDSQLDMVFHSLHGAADNSATGLQEATLRGVAHWRGGGRNPKPLLITAASADQREALFLSLCQEAGVRALTLDAADLPADPGERERLARMFTREAALWPAALWVRTTRVENASLLQAWLERVHAPVAVEVEAGSAAERLSGMRLDTPALSHAERRALWEKHLGGQVAEMNGTLDAMVDVFGLDAGEIRATAEAVKEELELGLAHDGAAASAWRLSRTAARRSLDDLAARAESFATWDDLVLPEEQLEVLRQISAHARQTFVVLRDWGFAARYARGLGLSVLFAGASGTGKTMAAGVLARELNRDLYQIDLATVVSKYIGETEKHLRRIFDAAERSGAILLFDEADALFGKRSQVKDSHDRYANLEISYLLQRMEAYRGIAILTTNMQNSLDPAFQRRLRFVVQFPFPDAASRERIWRGVFPADAPVDNLDYTRLAQLNVTGGVIRNIALLAAFLAADEKSAIAMHHVRAAARTEYAKLEKPLVGAETRGWG